MKCNYCAGTAVLMVYQTPRGGSLDGKTYSIGKQIPVCDKAECAKLATAEVQREAKENGYL